MKLRYLLLASTVLPLAMGTSVVARERPSAPMLLAQADQPPCPEGQECPPPGDAQAPAVEPVPQEPAPQDVAPEPPAPEPDQPAAEQPVPQDIAPQEPAPEPPPPVEEPAPQPPAAEPPVEPAPPQDVAPEPPAVEQPAPEPPAVEDVAPQEPAVEQPAPQKPRRQRNNNQPPAQQPQEPAAPPPQPDQPQPEPVAPSPDQAGSPPQGEGQPPIEDSTVEQQLDAQGDQGEAKNVRNLRERLQQQLQNSVGIFPEEGGTNPTPPAGSEGNTGNNNRNRNRDHDQRNGWWNNDQGGDVVERRGGRIVIDLGNGNLSVEPVAPDEGGRLLYGADDVEVQNLPHGQTRTIVHRRNGVDIVTVRDRYGDIVKRSKLLPDGTEIVLIDNRFPDDYDGGRPPVVVDLPPPVIGVPEDQYIVDYGRATEDDIRRTLRAPLVQRIDRPYTLDEVLQNQDVRAYSPRIDLDSITFETGSATIGNDQMRALFSLGQAMEQVIAENPDEVYLIEGHTDKVGSARDNLILSDQRAEAVATALSQNFEIPPENLVTKGYGEAYPKINTDEAERRNRRAAIRRLTDLLQAQNQ